MSYAITLHDIPDDLYAALRAEADRLGTSMNRAAKSMLAAAAGLVRTRQPDHDAELAPFFGGLDDTTWRSAKKAVAESRIIDPEDWA